MSDHVLIHGGSDGGFVWEGVTPLLRELGHEVHTPDLPLTDNGVPTDISSVFSPNGEKIAFHTNRDGNFEIYKMSSDGTKPFTLTDDPAGDFTPA